jgi:acyl carrier protein
MRNLDEEIKTLIIESLDLEDITPADIDSAAPLFVEGLGLDSIDALELGLHLQKKYGIKLDGNSEDTKKYFASVNALKQLIESQLEKS